MALKPLKSLVMDLPGSSKVTLGSIFLTVWISIALVTFSIASATELKHTPITLQQYLEVVRQNNAVIGSAALDVQNATANKVSQSLYQLNPSVSYARGNYHNQRAYGSDASPVSSTYGLSFTIEGWGKRGARENLAQAQTDASVIQLEQTKSNVELNAIFAYIDTLRLNLMLKSLREASLKLKSLPMNMKAADAQRFIDGQKANMEEDLAFTSLNLLNYSGGAIQGHPAPTGALNFPVQNYKVEELVAQGQSQRIEILSLESSIDMADKNITLTKQNRNINVYPYISQTRIPQYQYTNGASYALPAIGTLPAQTITNPGTTYSAANTISAGITIPIPITNYLQNADIVTAANQKLSYEMQLKDLKEQIRVQVLQASLRYRASARRLERAQEEHRNQVMNPNKNPVLAVMDLRDSEGALLDAKTNHLKALISLWRQSGNYSVPTL
jgi:outer membrane protein TolC